MGKWGRYDGITADFKESDAKPGGPGWFPVIEGEDGELRRKDSTEVTWKCDICHEERPDKMIDVAKHVHIYPRCGSSEVGPGELALRHDIAMEHNVKFCKDKDDCRTKAMVRTHFDQADAEVVRRQDDIARRLKKMHRAPFFWFLGVLFGVVGTASVYELVIC